jgi:hypothetical protein
MVASASIVIAVDTLGPKPTPGSMPPTKD